VKHDDLFGAVPFRFVDAFRASEIDALQFGLGSYLAALCFEAKNTSAGAATVWLSNLAEMFGVSHDTVGRRLHGLEPTWIECEVKVGQPAWRIRLTGLARPAQPPQALRGRYAPEGSPVRSVTYASEQPPDGANPHSEKDSGLFEATQSDLRSDDRRDETRRDKTKARIEERLDQDRSEVREPATDDEHFFAVLDALNEKPAKPSADWRPPVSRLERLEPTGSQPPAGEETILAEVDELLVEGVLREVAP
jgi:hypothetical protein